MKSASAILLLVAFMVQSFSNYFIYLDYRVNKNYISKYLCENKNKPEMKCEGHCYLCKRLKKESKDQEAPEKKNDSRNEIISLVPEFYTSHLTRITVSFQYAHVHESLYNCFISSFFHPPSC